MTSNLEADGFEVFAASKASLAWARAAHRQARGIAADPAQQRKWLRGKGTWFVGVDALDNAPSGAVEGVAFASEALARVASLRWTPAEWHSAQLSVVYPGYPGPVDGESAAAARYRRKRDAAHVDGLHAVGPDRRRVLAEPHAFVLGVSLNAVAPTASPLVVWRGSHIIMGAAFADALAPYDSTEWPQIDLTNAYQAARRVCFEQCERVELPLQPGQASLLHRHCLHGIAPWQAGAAKTERMIAYFRPQFPSMSDWITA